MNIYLTSNSVLINGKDVDRFMNNHLPIIHDIMWKPIKQGDFDNVMQLNRIIAEQLTHVIQQRHSDITRNVQHSRSQSPEINVDSSRTNVDQISDRIKTTLSDSSNPCNL